MKVIKNVEEIRKIISESILSGKYGIVDISRAFEYGLVWGTYATVTNNKGRTWDFQICKMGDEYSMEAEAVGIYNSYSRKRKVMRNKFNVGDEIAILVLDGSEMIEVVLAKIPDNLISISQSFKLI